MIIIIIDSYAVASHQRQRQMSKILSEKENSRPKPKAETAEEKPQNKSSGTVQESIQTNGIFSGASMGVINIQNLVLPEASGSKHAAQISAPKKKKKKLRRRRSVAVMLSNLQMKRTAEFLCNRRSRYIITLW